MGINYSTIKNITPCLLVLTALYISFMVISNLTASKITTIWGFNITAGIYFFPFTYIIDDIITEVYGFKASRKIIWAGFAINILINSCCYIATLLPPANFWPEQKSFEAVFYQTPKILFASVISYFFGEFLNSFTLSKLKVKTAGKYFWLRASASTSIGVIVDSLIFCTIAFYGILPNNILIDMILVQCVFKIGYELLMLPITTKIVSYVKKKDSIDVFDYNINYNPFKL